MVDEAKLIFKSKQILNLGLVKEIIIWEVPKNSDYPEGIKYRLVIADPIWKKVIILFDNHAPKGHHWHDIENKEYVYNFISLDTLLNDFLVWEKILENRYENNEN
jgi:hypothetical protein